MSLELVKEQVNKFNQKTTKKEEYSNKSRLLNCVNDFNNFVEKNTIKNEKYFNQRDTKLTNDYIKKSTKQSQQFLDYTCKIKKGNDYIINDLDFYNLLDREERKKGKIRAKKDTSYLDKKYKIKVSKNITKAYAISERNEDKTSVMLTFTGLTKDLYFRSNKKKTKKIRNKNCKRENSEIGFVETMKNLSKFRRDFYLRFKKALAKRKLNTDFDTIANIEITKSGNPHLHYVLYLEPEQIEVCKIVYDRVIEDIQKLQKVKYQHKFTTTDKVLKQSAASYVMKYLIKDLENLSRYYAKYGKYFRFFTTSNLDNTQEEIELLYKYLSKNDPKVLIDLKKENKNIYIHLDNMLKDKYIEYDYKFHNVIKSKKLKELKELRKPKIIKFCDFERLENDLIRDNNLENELIKNNYSVKKELSFLYVKINNQYQKIYSREENKLKYKYHKDINRLED